jgi:RecA/RadA recombinase
MKTENSVASSDAYQDSGTSPTTTTPEIDSVSGQEDSQPYEYLIEGVLPSGRVNVLVGPSGSGKTTLILQWVEAWLAGEPILGQRTYRPLLHITANCAGGIAGKGCQDANHWSAGRILYLAADRGKTDTEETLDRVLGRDSPLKCRPIDFEWRSVLESQYDTKSFIREAVSGSTVKILIIEGAATLVEGGRLSDNGVVAPFLKELSQIADECKIAIILVLHAPKTKKGEEYKNPRDRILGAVAWSAYSSTVLVLSQDKADEIGNRNRTLVVLPRNHPSLEYHLAMTREGRLAEVATPGTPMSMSRVTLLTTLEPGKWYPRKEVLEIGEGLGLSQSTVDRYIRAFHESGALEKEKPENSDDWRERSYRRPALSPPATGAKEG